MNTQPQIIHADVLIDRKASTIAAPCAVSIDDESLRTVLAGEERRQAVRDASGDVSASAIAPQRT